MKGIDTAINDFFIHVCKMRRNEFPEVKGIDTLLCGYCLLCSGIDVEMSSPV